MWGSVAFSLVIILIVFFVEIIVFFLRRLGNNLAVWQVFNFYLGYIFSNHWFLLYTTILKITDIRFNVYFIS